MMGYININVLKKYTKILSLHYQRNRIEGQVVLQMLAIHTHTHTQREREREGERERERVVKVHCFSIRQVGSCILCISKSLNFVFKSS